MAPERGHFVMTNIGQPPVHNQRPAGHRPGPAPATRANPQPVAPPPPPEYCQTRVWPSWAHTWVPCGRGIGPDGTCLYGHRKPQKHHCDHTCVCPIHGTQLYYAPAHKKHACQDPDCVHAHGMQPQEHTMDCRSYGAHPHAGHRCPECPLCTGLDVNQTCAQNDTAERPPTEHTLKETSAERTHPEENRPTVRVLELALSSAGSSTYVVQLATVGMERAVATCPYREYAELVAEGLRRLSADEVECLLDRG